MASGIPGGVTKLRAQFLPRCSVVRRCIKPVIREKNDLSRAEGILLHIRNGETLEAAPFELKGLAGVGASKTPATSEPTNWTPGVEESNAIDVNRPPPP